MYTEAAVMNKKISEMTERKGSFLAIANSFTPETTPTSNRSTKLLQYLSSSWGINIITKTKNSHLDNTSVHIVRSWHPTKLLKLISKLKLDKFSQLLIFPDDDIFWVIPAVLTALKVIKVRKPNALVVFMMPYSAGLVGIILKWITKIPLVLNLDDSLTCTDMHPVFPSWLHYRMTYWLEDFYVHQADQIIYVSQFNLDEVKKRQPIGQHSKFKLVRYGADAEDFVTKTTISQASVSQTNPSFSIVYIGGMNGWYSFCEKKQQISWFKKIYQWWMKLGQYEVSKVDFKTSSPMFVGKAVQKMIENDPSWKNRIRVNIYGNKFPDSVVNEALSNTCLTEVVSVSGSIPNTRAIQIACDADLLFMTLPKRLDGSEGGRISAKTYEYLMTDRPILAALPQGENWNYLQQQPGVYLVEPDDIEGMAKIIAQLTQQKDLGQSLRIDRSGIQKQLSYIERSDEFSTILCSIISVPNAA